MTINCKRTETASQSFEDLASIREQILTAAKEAEESGRHDSIEVLLPPGKYTIHEPFVLSAKENPELLSLDITLKGKYERRAYIQALKLIKASLAFREIRTALCYANDYRTAFTASFLNLNLTPFL